MLPARYAHQQTTVDFVQSRPRMLNFSDPGTGKTRAHLDALAERGTRKRCLIVAPLSILEAAWANDIDEFQPGLTYSIADARHRMQAFEVDTDIVLTNHDGIKALHTAHFKTHKGLLNEFDTLIIDEATAFKNLAGRGCASRTRAMADLRHLFEHRQLLTGTPATNSVLDVWAIAFLCDDGARLGESFYAFRNQVTTPVQVGPSSQMIQWQEKPGALDNVTDRLSDITIRFKKSDCIDIPPNHVYTVHTTLPPAVMRQYNELARASRLELDNGAIINAVHAGARAQKLLQLCTGATYDEHGNAAVVHTERYKMIIDLVLERPWPCVVVFNWRHEREQLVELAKHYHLPFEILDGETPVNTRRAIVRDFQNEHYRALFIHPKAAAHGLTLTAGRSTIWSSPTSNAEHFIQASARIDRSGQQHTTETILVTARNTRETRVYDMLQGNMERVNTLLELLIQQPEAA